MGKARDLFKKIRDTKGTFHAKMGSIKGRKGMDLIEAEDIKKRWQDYMEELYKKDLLDPDNHDDVITNLEPDILECEVKWALESITICQQIRKTQQWPQDWKGQFSFQSQRKTMPKNAKTTEQLHSSHMLIK